MAPLISTHGHLTPRVYVPPSTIKHGLSLAWTLIIVGLVVLAFSIVVSTCCCLRCRRRRRKTAKAKRKAHEQQHDREPSSVSRTKPWWEWRSSSSQASTSHVWPSSLYGIEPPPYDFKDHGPTKARRAPDPDSGLSFKMERFTDPFSKYRNKAPSYSISEEELRARRAKIDGMFPPAQARIKRKPLPSTAFALCPVTPRRVEAA